MGKVRGVSGPTRRVMWGLSLTPTQRRAALETANSRAQLQGIKAPVVLVTAKVETNVPGSVKPGSLRTKRGFWTAKVVAQKAAVLVVQAKAKVQGLKSELEAAEGALALGKKNLADRQDVFILNAGEVVPAGVQATVKSLIAYRGEILCRQTLRVQALRGAVFKAESKLLEVQTLQVLVGRKADQVEKVHVSQQAKWTEQAKAVYAYLLERGVVQS